MKELYDLYSRTLNVNEDESKIIFTEIIKKEKSTSFKKELKNKKAPFYLYLIASTRNICSYLLFYIGLRAVFTFGILKTNLPRTFQDFMATFVFVCVMFFVVGSFASRSIKKNTGMFNHTIYLKFEILIVLLIIIILELLYF